MIKPASTESLTAVEPRSEAHPGWWTVLAILATAWIGIPSVLPIAAAAPWFFFQRRNPESARRLTPLLRWSVATWVAGLAMFALAGERAIRSVPLGGRAAEAAQAWVEGTGAAIPPLPVMAMWVVLFAIAAVASRGIAGPIVLAHVLLCTAVHAGVAFAHSSNVLSTCTVALPIWSALLLCGMILLLDPLGRWGERRVWRRSDASGSRRRLVVGAGLVAAAFLARLALAGPLTDVMRRLTLP